MPLLRSSPALPSRTRSPGLDLALPGQRRRLVYRRSESFPAPFTLLAIPSPGRPPRKAFGWPALVGTPRSHLDPAILPAKPAAWQPAAWRRLQQPTVQPHPSRMGVRAVECRLRFFAAWLVLVQN